MVLPIFQSDSKDLSLLQTNWAAQINPVLKNTIIQGLQLSEISLINGATTFNHRLSRTMQGYFITDQNAAASIYRSQPFNDKTLTLTSNAVVTVNLWVY